MIPAILARVTDSVPVLSCAWCPGFNPRDLKHQGVSHGICPTCAAKLVGEGA